MRESSPERVTGNGHHWTLVAPLLISLLAANYAYLPDAGWFGDDYPELVGKACNTEDVSFRELMWHLRPLALPTMRGLCVVFSQQPVAFFLLNLILIGVEGVLVALMLQRITGSRSLALSVVCLWIAWPTKLTTTFWSLFAALHLGLICCLLWALMRSSPRHAAKRFHDVAAFSLLAIGAFLFELGLIFLSLVLVALWRDRCNVPGAASSTRSRAIRAVAECCVVAVAAALWKFGNGLEPRGAAGPMDFLVAAGVNGVASFYANWLGPARGLLDAFRGAESHQVVLPVATGLAGSAVLAWLIAWLRDDDQWRDAGVPLLVAGGSLLLANSVMFGMSGANLTAFRSEASRANLVYSLGWICIAVGFCALLVRRRWQVRGVAAVLACALFAGQIFQHDWIWLHRTERDVINRMVESARNSSNAVTIAYGYQYQSTVLGLEPFHADRLESTYKLMHPRFEGSMYSPNYASGLTADVCRTRLLKHLGSAASDKVTAVDVPSGRIRSLDVEAACQLMEAELKKVARPQWKWVERVFAQAPPS